MKAASGRKRKRKENEKNVLKDKGDVFQRDDDNEVQASDPKSAVMSAADATVEALPAPRSRVQQQHVSEVGREKLLLHVHVHFRTQHTLTPRMTNIARKRLIKNSNMLLFSRQTVDVDLVPMANVDTLSCWSSTAR